jgi:hypothetical protein
MVPLPTLLGTLLQDPVVFAQGGRLSQMGSRFRDSAPRGDVTGLLGMIGSLLLLGFAVWSFTRWYSRRESRPLNSPKVLFRELCRAHQLGHADRKLLREIADWHGMADPVQLFLEPQHFQSADMREALACEYEADQLHHRLFGISI